MFAFARPYTPDLVGWAARLRQRDGDLRRERPLRAHDAGLQRVRLRRRRRRRHARRQAPGPSAARSAAVETGNLRRCPGAATRAPADGSAPFVDSGDRTPTPTATRRSGREAADDAAVGGGGPACSCSARRPRPTPATRGGDDAYLVRAMFDNASFVIAGEDVKIAGVDGRRDRLARPDRGQQGGRRAADRRPRVQAVPQRRALPRRAAVADRRAVRRVRADAAARGGERAAARAADGSRTAAARASTCCRSSTPSAPVGVDLINDIMRLPAARAAAADHQRARRRAGRQRRGAAAPRSSARARRCSRPTSSSRCSPSRTGARPARRRVRRGARPAGRAAQGRSTASSSTPARPPRRPRERGDALEQNFAKLPAFLRELKPAADRFGALADEMTPAVAGARRPGARRERSRSRGSARSRAGGDAALDDAGRRRRPRPQDVPADRAARSTTSARSASP